MHDDTSKTQILTSPVTGRAAGLGETPDTYFASGLMGSGAVLFPHLLDTLARCRAFFEGLGWPAEVMQIQSAQSRPLGQDIFLAAANPVFLLAVDKPEQEKDED